MLGLWNLILDHRFKADLILKAPAKKNCLKAFFFNQNGVVQYHRQLFMFGWIIQLMERT
jgi:hypothetical protein